MQIKKISNYLGCAVSLADYKMYLCEVPHEMQGVSFMALHAANNANAKPCAVIKNI